MLHAAFSRPLLVELAEALISDAEDTLRYVGQVYPSSAATASRWARHVAALVVDVRLHLDDATARVDVALQGVQRFALDLDAALALPANDEADAREAWR